MGRWDYLYDLKARPALDVLLDEAAKALVDDLQRWPPPLESADPATAALFERERPHRLAYAEAFRLVRHDLLHEYEEIDAWEQGGWRSAQLSPEERDAAVFLWRYLAERIFDLNEAVESTLRRRDLVGLVDRVEKRFTAPSLIL